MLTAVTNRGKSGPDLVGLKTCSRTQSHWRRSNIKTQKQMPPLNQDGEQLRSSLMSFINHRERRPIVRRPPGSICKSFVDALPAANNQRSGRWSTPSPPSMPFTCMGIRPHGPCPGWRLWWWRGGGVGIYPSMAR